MRNVKIRKILFYTIFIGLIIFFLSYVIPLIKKEHELNKIRNQIEKIEMSIEANKQQRLNCNDNMRLRNEENEHNRQILQELKLNYNSMVGFTGA